MNSTRAVGAADTLIPASILSQGPNLIVSVHTALDDGQLLRLQKDLLDQVGRQRSRGIVIDVAAVDVVDSFALRTMADLARMAKLRGATMVIVGISPEVAIALVELSVNLPMVATALDLEEGLRFLGSAS